MSGAPALEADGTDVARLARVLRILAQTAHEIYSSLTDAATDLELLAPDGEGGTGDAP